MKAISFIRVFVLLVVFSCIANYRVFGQLEEVWRQTNPFNETFRLMALDGQNQVNMAGNFTNDIFAVKYSQTGTQLWARQDGLAFEFVHSMKADADGNVWVAGTTSTNANSFQDHAFLVKYNSAGERMWSQTFTQRFVRGTIFLALDNAGNSFLAAYFHDGPPPVSKFPCLIVKYSPDGELLWSREFRPNAEVGAIVTGLAVDSAGAVVLGGYSWNPDAGSSTLLLKYRADGTLAWSDTRKYGTSENRVHALVLDPDGNPHVTGRAGGGRLVAKYSHNGIRQWHHIQSGSITGMDIQVDDLGDVVVASTEYTVVCYDKERDDCDYFYSQVLAKFNSSGNQVWSSHYYLNNHRTPALKIDNQRNAYVTSDRGLRKYSPGGALLWETSLAIPMPLLGFDLDGAGNIYAFGTNSVGKFSQSERPGAPIVESTNLMHRVAPGDTVTLSAEIEGEEPLSYQWTQFSFPYLRVVGTNQTLALTNIGPAQAGTYSLTVSNRLGSSTSPDFQLDVIGLKITGATSVLAGATATICSGTIGPVGPITAWQWMFNGAPLQHQTNICLYIDNVQTNQAGAYSVTGTGTNGTFTSEVLYLEVRQQAPQITPLHPSLPISLLVDEPMQICGNAIAGPPASFQWQFNGIDIPGETNPCIYIPQVNTNHAGSYRLVASNVVGSALSDPVDVTVSFRAPEGTIYVSSGSTNMLVGGDITLCANVTGGPRPALQWQFNNTPLPGETNRCLRLISVSTNGAGNYNLVATNDLGVLITPPITVSVRQQAPVFDYPYYPEQDVVEGGFATFYTHATGGPPPLYFLQQNGTNLPLPYINYGTIVQFRLLGVTPADQGNYTIVASNVIGMATSGVFRLNVIPAGPLDRWTQRNPLPQSLPLLTVIYTNNLWVTAGEQGTILTSSNGIDWAQQPRRTDIEYKSLTYGEGLYVVAGEIGAILTSPDGTNWTQRFSPATSLGGVAYGNGLFVAVGSDQGRGVVITSTNGINWTPHAINDILPVGVAFGDGKFVAVGYGFHSAGAIASSTDGVTWNVNPATFPELFENVGYGGGRFITVGRNGFIYASTNGTSWTRGTTGSGRRFIDVAYGNNRYVAVGVRGTILISLDGLQWTPQNSGTPDRLEAVGFGNGLFVALGENGTIITSTDGTTWQKRNFGTTRDLDGMTLAFGKIVVAGKHGVILTSTNGIDYTEQATGTAHDLHGVSFGNGLLVAVGEPGVILTSPDAINWTGRASGTTNSLKRAVYGGGLWIVVGTEGTILTSTDGIVWTDRSLNNFGLPPFDLNAAAYGNGMYVIVGDGTNSQNGSAYYSPDGIEWTRNYYEFGKNLRGITFAQDVFMVTANDGFIFVSTNGITWNARISGWIGNLREVLFTNGFWTVVGNFGGILTSTNTFDWKIRPTQTFENLHQGVDYNGRLVTIGNRGTILQSGRYVPALNTFSFNPTTGAELVYAGVEGMEYILQASTDLTTWSTLTTFTNASEAMTYRDTFSVTNDYRFYRLIEQ